MPTDIKRRSALIMKPGEMPEASGSNLALLAIVAILTFVFHLAIGIVLDRSHAGQTNTLPASEVTDGNTGCGVESKQPDQSLPYD